MEFVWKKNNSDRSESVWRSFVGRLKGSTDRAALGRTPLCASEAKTGSVQVKQPGRSVTVFRHVTGTTEDRRLQTSICARTYVQMPYFLNTRRAVIVLLGNVKICHGLSVAFKSSREITLRGAGHFRSVQVRHPTGTNPLFTCTRIHVHTIRSALYYYPSRRFALYFSLPPPAPNNNNNMFSLCFLNAARSISAD